MWRRLISAPAPERMIPATRSWMAASLGSTGFPRRSPSSQHSSRTIWSTSGSSSRISSDSGLIALVQHAECHPYPTGNLSGLAVLPVHLSWAQQARNCVSAWSQCSLTRPEGQPSFFQMRYAQTAISSGGGGEKSLCSCTMRKVGESTGSCWRRQSVILLTTAHGPAIDPILGKANSTGSG